MTEVLTVPNNKKDLTIKNQNDIDEYIDSLISKAEKPIEQLFANRLKEIKQIIADMFEKYQSDDVYVTWTEFNKYNRLNKELTRIGTMLTDDYRQIAKMIQKSKEDAYIEKFLMSLYLYETVSQTSMQFDVPSKEVIKSAIEQPIEFIRLMPTLQKHRDEVLKKIRMHITQGIMSGEGYSKIAKAIRDDVGMSKAQSLRVARTEAGRAMSQAGLDSAMVAKDNGLKMKKRWHATKDTRTRDTHRHLDGESVEIDQNFKSSGCVGQAPKLFIGVNSAKENINCRCKLLYYIDENELPTVMRARKDDGKNEVIPFMTYREWEKYKRKGGN
ncbi:phage head morphogenesis protein [Staphylococcus aureus]|uniref:Phage head morphogenesis protein n=6 Tax=Staphylococcus aureus TaxID=1280 RepID=A0AB74E670_STAAU|nr:phage head morphogenesis protein [Staphylococcus aureus]MBW0702645.1 phage head morphogenesis protein [Staphylococcus aureus]MBW0708104.1 phage head morphogenesis protein [Staphylococcus aureus]MBW0713796.1 phage head morphogenesis protein [Staphylococcus aureus]MBW0719943.1 phage head morphogenesis protein [Staphylococcus aureus]MBW0733476.1 phage head morphogenesis protein [Staphylococcus aureus]